MSTTAEQEETSAPVPEDEPSVLEPPAAPDEDEEAAEAEEDERPEPPADEPPEPPVAAVGESEIEEQRRKLERSATTWRNRVSDVMGEAAQALEPCPRCLPWLPGFVFPADLVPVTDEQRAAVKQSIGELAEPRYRQDTHSAACHDCDGEGRVLTGSKVRGQERAQCLSCEGRGWVGPRAGRTPQPGTGANGPVALDFDSPPEPSPVTDPWGRSQDDPLFGVMPGYERG